MDKGNKELERQLVILCNEFINIFDKLLMKDLITKEEYEAHTKLKKLFLRDKENILKK